jgi:chaperonin GroES
MQERFLTTDRGTFKLAEYDGRNRAGLKPLCDNVLVLIDAIAGEIPVAGTEVKLHMTDQAQETGTLGSTTGVIIAVGPQAFAYDMDRLVKWEGERPKPGDRIWFQRYAGQEHTGLDGKLYRIMQDRTIAGMEDKEAMALIAAEGEADQVVRRARA